MLLLGVLLLALVHTPSALRIAVTGATGYLGAEVVCQAVAQGHAVRAVLRSSERPPFLPAECELLQLDDLLDPASAREAAEGVDAVIHTASVFRRCDDMEFELVRPNIELAEQMVCACAASGARLVLTSSMAAVRGGGQEPRHGAAFTVADWNSVSRRDGPGFEPYQFSKMKSERSAWELAKIIGAEMATICPSMIFGPPRVDAGISVDMVRGWVEGRSAVRSLLVCDVRDVAAAHLRAAELPEAAGKRYIVSCEARVGAAECAEALRVRLSELGHESLSRGVSADTDESSGGAIPIGEREVVAAPGLEELGVRCRSTEETIADMGEALATHALSSS